MSRGSDSRAGFTLIELLVAIGVIGLLLALLIPAVQSAREASRRTGCQNNLRQLGIALSSFESAHGRFPPGRDADQDRHHSWVTAILGYVDQAALFQQYDHRRAWDDPANATVVATSLALFRCPSAVRDWPGKTDYGGNYGSTLSGLPAGFSRGRGWEAGTLLAVRMPYGDKFRKLPVGMREVTDGASQTLLVLESADRAPQEGGLWANGHNCLAIDKPINSKDSHELRSGHPGGAHVLLADGSIRLLSESMDLELLGGLATRSNKEITD